MMRYKQGRSKVYVVWCVMLSNYICYPFHLAHILPHFSLAHLSALIKQLRAGLKPNNGVGFRLAIPAPRTYSRYT